MAGETQSPVAIGEVKALLRLATDEEDALIAGFAASATAACEAFIGQSLIARDVREIVAADGSWRRLQAAPVRGIGSAAALAVDGAETALSAEHYAVDVDATGDGWVRARAESGRVAVTFSAGIAAEADGVPEPLRQGIVRLAAHLYLARGEAEAPPPASVAALWRPWRRLRLG